MSLKREDIITLMSLPGIGNSIVDRILEKDEIKSLEIFKELHKEFKLGIRMIDKLSYELRNNFDRIRDESLSIIEECEKKKIKIITKIDKNYPSLLRDIKDSPSILYVRCKIENNVNWGKKSVAIVGTRDATNKGKKWAYEAGRILTELNFNIVSGLALGIDTAGHKGSISAGIGRGITTAAITNVDSITPKSNIELAEQIIENDGVLLSENAPGTSFDKSQLIKRNRIQSGLSSSLFVVECGRKSGTLHTIGFAEAQGRNICCPSLNELDSSTEQTYTIKKLSQEKKA